MMFFVSKVFRSGKRIFTKTKRAVLLCTTRSELFRKMQEISRNVFDIYEKSTFLAQGLLYNFFVRKKETKKPHNRIVFDNLKEAYVSQDMIAITTYFNPAGYVTKKRNFLLFRDNLKKQGIPLLVVECSFDYSPYELDEKDADILVRVNAQSRIWQKERLLNIALEHIPKEYTKFCSLDCDIIFQNPSWITETSQLLDVYPVVQPFEYSYRLHKEEPIQTPQSYTIGRGEGSMIHGIAKGMKEDKFQKDQGHTGFAWAFRRDSFEYFYDKFIIGGGDTFLSYAFYGKKSPEKIINKIFVKDMNTYIIKIYAKIRGRVGFANGLVLHLWHGDTPKRLYGNRQNILKQMNFNPRKDLKLNKDGCWEVSEDLNTKISEYFSNRQED